MMITHRRQASPSDSSSSSAASMSFTGGPLAANADPFPSPPAWTKSKSVSHVEFTNVGVDVAPGLSLANPDGGGHVPPESVVQALEDGKKDGAISLAGLTPPKSAPSPVAGPSSSSLAEMRIEVPPTAHSNVVPSRRKRRDSDIALEDEDARLPPHFRPPHAHTSGPSRGGRPAAPTPHSHSHSYDHSYLQTTQVIEADDARCPPPPPPATRPATTRARAESSSSVSVARGFTPIGNDGFVPPPLPRRQSRAGQLSPPSLDPQRPRADSSSSASLALAYSPPLPRNSNILLNRGADDSPPPRPLHPHQPQPSSSSSVTATATTLNPTNLDRYSLSTYQSIQSIRREPASPWTDRTRESNVRGLPRLTLPPISTITGDAGAEDVVRDPGPGWANRMGGEDRTVPRRQPPPPQPGPSGMAAPLATASSSSSFSGGSPGSPSLHARDQPYLPSPTRVGFEQYSPPQPRRYSQPHPPPPPPPPSASIGFARSPPRLPPTSMAYARSPPRPPPQLPTAPYEVHDMVPQYPPGGGDLRYGANRMQGMPYAGPSGVGPGGGYYAGGPGGPGEEAGPGQRVESRTRAGLIGTARTVQGRTYREYPCRICGKQFARPSTLEQHERVHSGVRPFVCPFPGCGVSFTTRSNQRRHSSLHDRPGSTFYRDAAASMAPQGMQGMAGMVGMVGPGGLQHGGDVGGGMSEEMGYDAEEGWRRGPYGRNGY